MARKVVPITIGAEGRDKSKTYVLTEMPALQAEKWAMRAFLALARSGVELPEGLKEAGLAGLAVISFQALSQLGFDDAVVLMDEMMTCVQIMPDQKDNPTFARPLVDGDVEEIATLTKLRMEVFTLHTGFSLADVPSMFLSMMASSASQAIKTSPGSSGQ